VDKERLQELLGEATVDCYNEEEEFWGMFCTLEDRLSFPLQARVRKSGQEYTVALSEAEILEPDPVSAEWLAMYRY